MRDNMNLTNLKYKLLFLIGIAVDQDFIKRLRQRPDLCRDMRRHGVAVWPYSKRG
jgi:hypothetical protein